MSKSQVSMSADIGALAKALGAAQAQGLGAVKNATNPGFKSRFADLSSVWDAVRQPFADHGLSVIQMPGYADGAASVTTILMHESGQWIRSQASSPIVKNDPQGVGSAITYLRRYALAAVAGVCPEDDDGNAASHPPNATHAHAEPAVPRDPVADMARLQSALEGKWPEWTSGSEKQQGFATGQRKRVVTEWARLAGHQSGANADKVRAHAGEMLTNTDPKWWLDHFVGDTRKGTQAEYEPRTWLEAHCPIVEHSSEGEAPQVEPDAFGETLLTLQQASDMFAKWAEEKGINDTVLAAFKAEWKTAANVKGTTKAAQQDALTAAGYKVKQLAAWLASRENAQEN